jgi:hypothetical protein
LGVTDGAYRNRKPSPHASTKRLYLIIRHLLCFYFINYLEVYIWYFLFIWVFFPLIGQCVFADSKKIKFPNTEYGITQTCVSFTSLNLEAISDSTSCTDLSMLKIFKCSFALEQIVIFLLMKKKKKEKKKLVPLVRASKRHTEDKHQKLL